MMDFGSFPPEIHSMRIYSGPGSSSLLAAASAWSGLAGELSSTATGYETVVTRLSSEGWTGPASAAMAESAAPYIAWLRTTAAQAEQSADKARLAASAYETALASVVPPPQIAANRAQLEALVATNLLGQNASAIAANEAQYGEMWAQDTAAMYQYAGTSAVAAAVKQYVSPPQTSNPAAAATQGVAATQAAATSAGAAQNSLSQLVSAMPNALQSLASPLTSAASSPANSLQQFLNWYGPFGNFFYDTSGLPFFGAGITTFFTGTAASLGLVGPGAAAASLAPAEGAAGAAAGAAGAVGPALAGSTGVSATLAGANSVGSLSVPPAWAGSSPAASPAIPSRFVSEVIEPESASHAGNLVGGMPLAGVGKGSAAAAGPRYGARLTVMAQPPSAG